MYVRALTFYCSRLKGCFWFFVKCDDYPSICLYMHTYILMQLQQYLNCAKWQQIFDEPQKLKLQDGGVFSDRFVLFTYPAIVFSLYAARLSGFMSFRHLPWHDLQVRQMHLIFIKVFCMLSKICFRNKNENQMQVQAAKWLTWEYP